MGRSRKGHKRNILVAGSKNLSLENWKVYHPNGKHMFTCGGKKARWYLERDLAIQVDDFEIQLTFQPNGTGFRDNEIFGKSIREARCVVTGIRDDLQRHHIVPYCYRTHFPQIYKSKNHHDVVLINHDIHAEYEIEAMKFKNEMAKRYGLKTIGEYNRAYSKAIREYRKDEGIILSKIWILLNSKKKIPQQKKLEFLDDISNYFNFDPEFTYKLNYIQLLKLYQIVDSEYSREIYMFKGRHSKYFDHGWHLVQKLNNDDQKIFEFVKLWRNHFIDMMSPKYMPEGWNLNFRHKTNF